MLHRLHSVNETWLHGRGRRLRVTGIAFTVAALGLADLPPFGSFLGQGWIDDSGDARVGPWLAAVCLACTVLCAGAVLRVAFGVFYGLGDPPSEDPRMAAEANEETGESPSGRHRTPLSMLAALLRAGRCRAGGRRRWRWCPGSRTGSRRPPSGSRTRPATPPPCCTARTSPASGVASTRRRQPA